MLENHTIARIAGIPIRANLLLGYLLALWFIWGASRGQATATLVLIVLSTLLLLLHELGHAVMARRFGLDVLDIVLWPLGGMARIREMPENARMEAWVAAAGPLVNLALAAISLPFVFVGDPETLLAREVFGRRIDIPGGFQGVAFLSVAINLSYGLFNLLPAFPMDGGRLLRAFLARGGRSWLSATDRATRVGSILAWALILWSIAGGACMLSLVGLFVLWAGLRERWVVRIRHQAEAMGGARGRFAGWEELLRRRGMGAAGTTGGVPGFGPGPGLGPGPGDGQSPGPPFGGAPTVDVDGGVPEGGSGPAPSRGGSGFSDEDIERLESFRGRLKRPESGDA
ncbi:MAG: site-2 protease family protein [Planctomycetota bacterium]